MNCRPILFHPLKPCAKAGFLVRRSLMRRQIHKAPVKITSPLDFYVIYYKFHTNFSSGYSIAFQTFTSLSSCSAPEQGNEFIRRLSAEEKQKLVSQYLMKACV